MFLFAIAALAAAASAATTLPATSPDRPAIARGADFLGFPERFNRYYTDPDWRPARTVYVSPDGTGDGTSRETPSSAKDAIAGATPGTQIIFLPGQYVGGFEIAGDAGGTYDAPIVLYGERGRDGAIAVTVDCNSGERKTCFNFEGANYIAVDGFELVGGTYGVRTVGTGYAASEHARGIAVLNCKGHDQDRDPLFSGQSDWDVWERNVSYGAKEGDGHGIYLSNGSDWNIVRYNETFGNVSSDFQINADPASTCADVGIAFTDPLCAGFAGEGEGGQGASDYFLVDSNYFHHSKGPGANFTSVRRSVIRNNVFGPSARHNVSFWQETDNPALGTSENTIVHNLFVTTDRHDVQFINNSDRNLFANNVLLGVAIENEVAAANPAATLMEVDDSVGANIFRSNLYIGGGLIEGRSVANGETARPDFDMEWFTAFPTTAQETVAGLKPAATAPFVNSGELISAAPADRDGVARNGKTTPGPFEP